MLRRILILAACLGLAACEESWLGSTYEPPLPGQRVSVLAHQQSLSPSGSLDETRIKLPRPTRNADWPQAGGYAHHSMQHLEAADELRRIWSSDIGAGSDSRNRILNEPIVAGGTVFTIDTQARLSAHDLETGREVWAVSLLPENEDEGEALMGGGLASDSGRIYATTGFAQLVALDAATGTEVWRTDMGGPVRAAPTVRDGQVFVITVDNKIHAVSSDTGEIQWSHSGIIEVASLLGAASPAVDSGVVVAALSSGELVALRVANGGVVWEEALSTSGRSDAVSSITDIKARPVIDKGRVYAVGHGGLMVAIDLRTGARLWELEVGGIQQPWVSGGYIYILTNDAEVAALDGRSGQVIWVTTLQRWEDEQDRTTPIIWSGPVLVSDRLVVAGSHGKAYAVSPYTGKFLSLQDMPAGVHIPPVIADGTVLFLTDDADLVAFK